MGPKLQGKKGDIVVGPKLHAVETESPKVMWALFDRRYLSEVIGSQDLCPREWIHPQ